MRPFFSKRITIGIIIAGLIISVFLVISLSKEPPETLPEPEKAEELTKREIIGKSVEGRAIEAYTFGKSATNLLFVGGMHGGYEWNSVVLAYEFIDYLNENPEIIPENLSVTVIPSLNPDGVYKVIGKEGAFKKEDVTVNKEDSKPGRFNANGVDLNRNFDCKWKPESTWQGNIVSAGDAPFSEPEAKYFRDFILKNEPRSVIFWHSQANAVYASECKEGVLPETLDIMNEYAKASGYLPVESFDQYEITGDVEGWLASIGIPAITVELETHETVEWNQNLAGVKSLFKYYEVKN